MQTTSVLLAVVMSTSITFGQQKPASRVKVLNVCEVLSDVNRYVGTAVAIVGRMERSVSLIDHSEVLSQDHCEHQVITHGHTWANKIQVWTDREEGMPKPPGDRPKLERAAIAAKLSAIRKTTTLGSHQEALFNADGRPTTIAVPDQWAVVYGRIVRSPRLNKDCSADGCGGDDVPLILVAVPAEVHVLEADGTLVAACLVLSTGGEERMIARQFTALNSPTH